VDTIPAISAPVQSEPVQPEPVEGVRTGSARRGAAVRAAICAAAFELLGELGYDQLSIDAVATRARASKATVYRWWPGKSDLVAEVVTRYFEERRDPPDTGTLRGDLIALLLLAYAGAQGAHGRAFSGLMTAATREPALARALHECMSRSRVALHETVVRRAVHRGELDAGARAELLQRIVQGLVFTARPWTAEPCDERLAADLVDGILIPVLTAH
jgi:AcrR family transcriptional regulator